MNYSNISRTVKYIKKILKANFKTFIDELFGAFRKLQKYLKICKFLHQILISKIELAFLFYQY